MHTTTKTIALSLALVVGAARAHAANTIVTLSFDDTLDDQAQVGDMLAAHGMHATFFVNSPRINQLSYMTMDQVMALQAGGNEIAGHTINHFDLAGLPMDEQQRQICTDRAQLLTMGFNITTFAYPHGATDLASHNIITDCGFNQARNASGLRSHDPESCTNCVYAEAMPPIDPLAIRTPVSIKSTQTLADLQQNVTDAEAHGGGWVPFVFHHVCNGCNSLAVSPATLTAFMDWLQPRAAANNTNVKTFQEVMGGTVNPAVPGPAPVQYVAPDGNLLRNASLEDDANGDGVPDCWLITSGGNDPSTYMSSIATDAHTGSKSESLSVVNGPSSPRIISFQDMGACAPSVTVGHTYKISAWVKSSDPVILVSYYRNSLGWWSYWAKSPAFPAAADWTLVEWTTTQAPMQATAISVGVSAIMSGSLTVDDLRLVDSAGPSVAPPDGGTSGDDAGTASPGDDGGSAAGMVTSDKHSGGCSVGMVPPAGAIAIGALTLLMMFLARRRPMP
jgi:peptidoglycan/xylan/chitin deacetylase (PgdA/CDA1 family)